MAFLVGVPLPQTTPALSTTDWLLAIGVIVGFAVVATVALVLNNRRTKVTPATKAEPEEPEEHLRKAA
jgi:hypothetical protein